MSFISKVCLLAMLACVYASPKAEQRAEGETGYWSKFLGKVPDYFKGPDSSTNEVQPSAPVDAAVANGEIQNDESSSYNNQIDPNKWQENFRQCVQSNMAQSSSSSSSSQSSSSGGQYGLPSNINTSGYDYTKFQESMEKCRTQMSAQIPSGASSQNYLQSFQLPSGLAGAFPGAPGSSSSGSSNA